MVLTDAMRVFVSSMDDMAFDERDSGTSFDDCIEGDICAFDDVLKELYSEFKELADHCLECASNLAYTYRVALSRERVGKAEDEFNQALDVCKGLI